MNSPEALTFTRARVLLSKLLIPLMLTIASVVFVFVNVSSHSQISPYDEYVYIDYLAKFPEQGIVATGEETGDFARNYVACNGVAGYGLFDSQSCGTNDHSDDDAYPFNGKTSADLYTPLYFAATWVGAQPFIWLGGMDLVDAGRMSGWIWLATGSVLLFHALLRLSVSQLAAGAASLLLIASVPAWWSATFISTDGSAFAAGAALLLAGIRFAQTGRGAWLLPVISVFAVAFKLQNYMAVVATAMFFLLSYLSKKQQQSVQEADLLSQQLYSRGKASALLGTMLIIPIVVQAIWMLIRKAIAVSDFPDQLVSEPFTLSAIIDESMKFFGQLGLSSTVPVNSTAGWALATIATWIIITGILSAIAVEPRFDIRYSLAISALFTMLVSGPALALTNLVAQGFYFPLPTRYGLSLLPVALALAATLFDKKRETRVALAIVAGVSFAASLSPYFPGIEV